MSVTKRALVFALALASPLLFVEEARGEPLFLQGATEGSVTDVVRPWTQSSACDCCVCWETAMSTVLSYWDDFGHGGDGPWDQIMEGGDRMNDLAFADLSDQLWRASGLDCDSGAWSWFIFDNVITAAEEVINDDRGYDFNFDFDEWVWFGQDLEDEIRGNRPVYYRFSDGSSPEPEGWQETEGHAITVVGVDPDTEVLYVYGNWDEILSQKGFDDADEHGTINITPGGYDCDSSSWLPMATTCGLGGCAATGFLECDGGFFFDSCEPGSPGPGDGRCDGVDEDCDGAIDEDYTPRGTFCGVGACAAEGQMVCEGGVERDTCAPGTPGLDTNCNGVDDDCDGQVDEDAYCDGPDGGPDGGGPDGGPDGGSDSGPSPDGGSDGGPDGGVTPPADGGEGCGCRAGGASPRAALSWLLVGAAWLLLRRR